MGALPGGANSAGQAAVNLARYARQVTIVVRGDSPAARMSQYLIDEISATPNIDVRTRTRIAAAEGTGELEAPRQAGGRPGGCAVSARRRAAWVVRYRCSGILVVRAAAAR